MPKYAMSPFSVGNRKCPSDHFSMAELTLVTAVVASAYRFEHAPGSDSRPPDRHHAPAARGLMLCGRCPAERPRGARSGGSGPH
ncbi:hypothetical protein GCM10023238_20840 [Streptomyces heliomycini]